MAQSKAHGKTVSEIQRLMAVYESLPEEVQKEILRFLSTPQMITTLHFKTNKSALHKAIKEFGPKYFYIV